MPIESIRQAIIADPENRLFTEDGIFPLLRLRELLGLSLLVRLQAFVRKSLGCIFRTHRGTICESGWV